MDVRADLIGIIREAVGDLAAAGRSPDWPAILERLEAAHHAALRKMDTDEGLLASVVSVANLLTDCARGVVGVAEISEAMANLDPAGGWEAGFPSLIRTGDAVRLVGDRAPGFSALHWRKFLDVFRERLVATNKYQEEELWRDMRGKEYHLPIDDVSLADPTGRTSAWVSDDGENGERFTQGDPTHDVYDALGLDWSGLPRETIDTDGAGSARALLLSCPLQVRERAAGSLHCPTSADGWNHLLFVAREPTDEPWPNHGCATARPEDDAPNLPEAVHGPAAATAERVRIVPLGHVRVGRRATECGSEVVARSIARLRDAVLV